MKCDEAKQQGRKENNMKHSVLAAMLAIASVQAVQAETGTSKPETFMDQFSVHGTLTLSSDYRSRGFSKSDQKL